MPALPNQRNDIYCRHRAKGMLPAKASVAAGYAVGSSTTHLEQDPEIIARIAELMGEQQAHREAQRLAAMEAAKMVGKMTGVGKAWVIQKLAENAQYAMQDGDYAQSNRALELIGKEFGMFSGGGNDEDEGAVPRTMDLDKLGALLEQTTEGLPALTTDPSRLLGEDMALSLIEGQTKRPDLARAREFSTGSETDVALTAEVMLDDEDLVDPPLQDPDA